MRVARGRYGSQRRRNGTALKALAERDDRLPVIEDHAGRKPFAQTASELVQTPEVASGHRCRSLHLQPRKRGVPLQHDVDLRAIPVAEVVEPDRGVGPTRLPSEFLKYESLQKLPVHRAVGREGPCIQTEQRRAETGVADVQLGGLDESAEPIAVPGRQPSEQEQPLEQGDVAADRRARELKRRGKIREVVQPCRL